MNHGLHTIGITTLAGNVVVGLQVVVIVVSLIIIGM